MVFRIFCYQIFNIVTCIIFLIVQHDQMKNQLKLSESAIEDLKNRLDDAMNAEDMLEQLTEKNLAQGEVIKSCYVIK
jgi:hypothetical protein